MKLFNGIKYALLALLLIITNSASAQDPNFHIYLCFGQSNMEGQGPIDLQDQNVDANFVQMQTTTCDGRTQGNWYTATSPLARCGTKFGPMDYFGRTMLANAPAGVKIGVIVVAVGGCDIQLFEKSGYANYLQSAAGYIQTAANAYGGNPYGRLMDLAKLAQKDGVIKGILLHQGETNSGQTTWPGRVKGVYDNMLSDLGLQASNVPLLVGEVLPEGVCAGHNSVIATVPNTIPTAHVVKAPVGTGVLNDGQNVHFSTPGYQALGVNYANVMGNLITYDMTTPTITITSPTISDSFNDPATITIKADASDTDGTIKKVEFFNGTTLLGEVTTKPYSFTWTNVIGGNYTISAVATDNDNKTSTAEVTIKVSAPALDGEITVRAAGADGTETIELEVDGVVIERWDLTTTMTDYTATANVNGTIRINFPVDNGDAQIDYIVVANKKYEAEDQAINTGYYANGACGGGSNSELMHCDGYIEFVTDPVPVPTDLCPNNPNKTTPGECGCDKPEGTCNGQSFALKKGWNLIAYPLTNTAQIEVAFASIIDYVDAVKDMDGFYQKGNPGGLNSLTELEWGKGYYIYVSQPCAIEWQ